MLVSYVIWQKYLANIARASTGSARFCSSCHILFGPETSIKLTLSNEAHLKFAASQTFLLPFCVAYNDDGRRNLSVVHLMSHFRLDAEYKLSCKPHICPFWYSSYFLHVLDSDRHLIGFMATSVPCIELACLRRHDVMPYIALCFPRISRENLPASRFISKPLACFPNIGLTHFLWLPTFHCILCVTLNKIQIQCFNFLGDEQRA